MTGSGQRDIPCSVERLEAILTSSRFGIVGPYNEITSGLFIGRGSVATDFDTLKKLGITHVLNASVGRTVFHVNTDSTIYKPHNITFMGIRATDAVTYDLTPHFLKAADFIEEGLQDDNKILVHCVGGLSRSATLVIVYYMLKKHMRVEEALRLVRNRRSISPNTGFLLQLCRFDLTLREKGHYRTKSHALI